MIRVETEGNVGVVTLARPDQRNALTPRMLDDLCAAVTDLGAACGCVMLRGEGRVFCAGFDLEACRASPEGAAMRALLHGLHRATRSIRACPAPVVIACQGAAIAGGCALIASADFTVADRGAKLGYPVTPLGVSPAVSAPTLIPVAGAGGARARMLDPGLVSAEEAQRLGLVSQLVDGPDGVLDAARQLAEDLAGKPREGMRATKSWLNRLDGTAGAGELALDASLSLTGGDEERELLAAYWERRRASSTAAPSPE